jgi:methyltransferase (TIGR00027 family)
MRRRSGRLRQPSLTSQAVAVVRAGLDRPHTPDGDPTAQRRLVADFRAGGGPALRAHLAARTAFVDGAVLDALAAGVRQVAVIGAGYDDRALRFRTPGVRFFELDHPDTQADKRGRVERLGAAADVRFVPVDLRTDDFGSALQEAGQDLALATLFICEGLLVYLDQQVIGRLLDSLRARAAPGSRLIASLAIHADGVDSARAVAVANGRRQDAETEPWRTILTRRAHLDLLAQSGWLTTREADLPSATGGGVTLLVQAEPAGAPG